MAVHLRIYGRRRIQNSRNSRLKPRKQKIAFHLHQATRRTDDTSKLSKLSKLLRGLPVNQERHYRTTSKPDEPHDG